MKNKIPQDLVIRVKNATDLHLAGKGPKAVDSIPEYKKMTIEEKKAVILEKNILDNYKSSVIL